MLEESFRWLTPWLAKVRTRRCDRESPRDYPWCTYNQKVERLESLIVRHDMADRR